MAKTYTVAKSWNELNEWQLQEIAHLYINTSADDFNDAFMKMVFILFQKKKSFWAHLRLLRLIGKIDIAILAEFASFLLNSTNFHRFPEVPGLIKPADRIGDITARHFSTIDTFFFHWQKDKSQINLKRLVATLYRIKPHFDELDLAKVAAITDKLPPKQMERIALAYLFTRMHITESFPIVFPKPKENPEQEKKPVFRKKDDVFVPFDKILVGMSMDEMQPLGKKQDINEVRIYEFLSVLSESIIYHEKKMKANAGK